MHFRTAMLTITLVSLWTPSQARIYKYWQYTDANTDQTKLVFSQTEINLQEAKNIKRVKENAKNSVDIVFALMAITAETEKEETTREQESPVIAQALSRGILQKQIVVANGGLIRKLIRLWETPREAQGDIKFSTAPLNFLLYPDWKIYEVGNGKVGVFIYKPAYFGKNQETNLEQIGLNKTNLKKIDLTEARKQKDKKKLLQKLKEAFKFEHENTYKLIKNHIDVDSLNKVWSENPKVNFNIIMDGHGLSTQKVTKEQIEEVEKTEKRLNQTRKQQSRLTKKLEVVGPEKLKPEEKEFIKKLIELDKKKLAKEKKLLAKNQEKVFQEKEKKEYWTKEVEKNKTNIKELKTNIKKLENLISDQEKQKLTEEKKKKIFQGMAHLQKEITAQLILLLEKQEKALPEARFAGLSTAGFLIFFRKMPLKNVQLLLLDTCSARGLNEIAYDENINFPIAAGSPPDTKLEVERRYYNEIFTRYYLFMKKVNRAGGWSQWKQQNVGNIQNLLKPVFKELATKKHNIFSIRLPGDFFFRTIPIGDTTEVISYPNLLFHQIKKGGKTALKIGYDIRKIALVADIVNIPIETHPRAEFFPMIFGPSHYYLEKLVLTSPYDQKTNLASVVKRFLNLTPFNHFFFVKNLVIAKHQKTKKEILLPSAIPEGKIEFSNVAILKIPKEDYPGIIYRHENQYYQLDTKEFKAIELSTELAQKTITRWARLTAPFKIALKRTTGQDTEKVFQKLIDKSLQ